MTGAPIRTPYRVITTPAEVRLRTDEVEARVNRTSGAVGFYDRTGKVVLAESATGGRLLAPTQVGGISTFKSRQSFVLAPDEAIFGLGQHQDGQMNYRDSIVHLQQRNTDVGVPVLVSSRGYGVLWDNPAITDVNVGAGDEQIIPAAQIFNEDGQPDGLTGRYYQGQNFDTLTATRTDAQVDFNWTTMPPAGLPHDNYSVRWTGFVQAKQAGDYVFLTPTDDGVRLWIDDQPLIDDWTSRALKTSIARVRFAANSRHRIRLEYYQDHYSAIVRLAWRLPGQNSTLAWASEAAKSIDYYFMYGPEIGQVIRDYRMLTGAAPLFGRWAWGLWQSKERYQSQGELLDIVGEYRRRHIPLDGIIQDWQYWPANSWGSHQFDPARYPDPTKLMQDLHAANVHMLISVWPKFDVGTANANELQAAGGLYPQVIPYVFPTGQGQWYDPFNPTARRIYWQQMSRQLFAHGMDGWWLDASEAELSGSSGEFRDFTTGAGSGAQVFNAYPLLHTTAVYRGQRAENSDKRVFILTRSAYAGQQRNAAVTWSGDVQGNWNTFAHQIPAGINFTLSGIPYWNTDTGGFFGGDPNDANYRELFTRWFQFSAFCPMLRVHGTGPSKEIWRFNEETQRILTDYDRLRYHLLPYIYSVSWQVTNAGDSMMRGLVMDFRGDAQVYNIPDQYLFGPALMVNPVTKPGATTRSVYLPPGTTWTDFWTGQSHAGGQTIEAAAPIQKMPLFVRAGSIIPYGPDIEHATEKSDPIELRVYRGANGSFALYEDEGDNYNYERGIHAIVPISWNEAAHTLTIGARSGSFPGMLAERTFRVVWVGPGHGSGVAPTGQADALVTYRGHVVTVSPEARAPQAP